MKKYPTLVLDAAYIPTAVFSHYRAFVLVFLGRAEMLESYKKISINSSQSTFQAPLVIRIHFLKRDWESPSPTRKAIFVRDNYTCAYCGKTVSDKSATIDHVIPKSKGGMWVWENLVTSCTSCNQKKGDRTPQEARMKLKIKPHKPSNFELEVKKWKLNDEFEEALKSFGGFYARD